MKTFSIFTLGCKVNTYESEYYRQSMIDAGFIEVMPKEGSDVVIINTCTVTNTASFKSRQRIHQAKRANPDAFVVVVGCYAQTHHDELLAKYDIDLMVGSKHKDSLVRLITEKIGEADYTYPSEFEELKIHSFLHQKKAYVKIQDGCNQFCSYCIIPFARGRERSLDPDKVLEQIKAFSHHREIVLTGIHTGRYGVEIGSSLTQLLHRILNETPIQRIRISSIEISEISDDLIELIRTQPRLARHLHIPLQAADDRLLKLMNRPYSLIDFTKRLEDIRSKIPDINISTDIIVGFPSETEDEFHQQLKTIEAMDFGFMHVFPFSKRAMTLAADYPGHLTEAQKKVRVHAMQDLSDRLQLKHHIRQIDQTLTVLIEEEQGDRLFGYSSHYMPVLIKGPDTLINTMLECKVYTVEKGFLIAETMNHETRPTL